MAQRFKEGFKSPEEFEAKCDEYFDNTPVKEQTRAGLCVHLGITTRTFINYKNGTQGDEFRDIAEFASTRLENKYEVDLNTKNNVTGPIFALKQYGWKENHDVEVKSSGFEIVCNVPRPEEK